MDPNPSISDSLGDEKRLSNHQASAEHDNTSPPSFRHAPRLAPVKEQPVQTNRLGFEYAEHGHLGDNIELLDKYGNRILASKVPLVLPSGLKVLSYGQINGLAGDFYGTADPISDGEDVTDRQNRFIAAWETLAVDKTRQPKEVNAILDALDQEVAAVNKAIANGEDPSKAYSTLPDMTATFQKITFGRSGPGYLGLSHINWDHFGEDAHTSYMVGHSVALQTAKDKDDLFLAYAQNAFADHFLEDSFAAGHVRTPRRELHGDSNVAYDICAKLMHDEDNAIGLSATNANGNQWTMYGDKRLYDDVDQLNLSLCQRAVQASADEIWNTWKTKIVPDASSYKALKFLPDLELARDVNKQNLAALFPFNTGERRKNVSDRHTKVWTKDWTAAGTVVVCETSGLWKYPITMT